MQVVVLRGINVGGRNRLAMADLCALLAEAGAVEPTTYIQSGNAVADGHTDGAQLANLIEHHAGFRPTVMVIDADEFLETVAGCPYPLDESNTTHIFFAAETPTIDHERAASLVAGDEEFSIGDRAVYVSLPHGMARSKLGAPIESCTSTPLTARNAKTVRRLASMLTSR